MLKSLKLHYFADTRETFGRSRKGARYVKMDNADCGMCLFFTTDSILGPLQEKLLRKIVNSKVLTHLS